MEERHMEVVPGLAGILAAESAISYVDGEKGILEYRGIPVELLAEKSTFLEVAYLLLFGKLPNAAEYKNFRSDITYHTRLKVKILRMIEFLPENGHPMEYLQSVVAAMGMYYPARDVMDEEVRYRSIIRLIAKMPTIVAACERLRHGDAPIPPNNDLSFAANFYYMLFEKVPDRFTEKIMGMGHRVYKTKDPRAGFLQICAQQLFKSDSAVAASNLLEIAEEVEKVALEKLAKKKIYPNVDFYSGIVLHAIGIPTELYTPIFAMGRVAGWLAHWLEQLKTNKIYRPDQKYIGLRNQKYVPMEKRKG